MEVSFKRGMDHNYLIINDIKEKDDYQIRMLEENTINHLLNTKRIYESGSEKIRYEISSMQPMSRIYDGREIGHSDLEKIVRGIVKAYHEAYEYMLDENLIFLNENYIYMNVENKNVSLMFYPDCNRDMHSLFLSFAEYLMDKVDHNDQKAVLYAYQIYRVVKNPNFVLADIENVFSINEDGLDLNEEDKEEVSIERDIKRVREDSSRNWEENVKTLQLKKDETTKERAGTVQKIKNFLFKKNNNNKEYNNGEDDELFIAEEFSQSENYTNKNELVRNDIGIEEDSEEYGKTVILTDNSADGLRCLVQIIKGKEVVYDINKFPVTIGKSKEVVDIVINDNSVSRMHAKIYEENGEYYLHDLGSSNGTYVNSLMLEREERILIEPGDELKFGRAKVEFR